MTPQAGESGGEVVVTSRIDRVLVVRLRRPEVLNALSTTVADALAAVAAATAEDPGVGAVVVHGDGDRAFCAGADIAEFGGLAGPDDFHAFLSRLGGAVEAIAALPQPVVAAVEGLALGGGCELAMACDLRVVSETARFGLPEVALGLLPGLGGTQRAWRLLPEGVARRMLLTGEPIGAAEAHRLGFCEAPVPAGGALDAAVAMASRLAAGAPDALAAAKDLLRVGRELPLPAALERERAVGRRLFGTAGRVEGVAAFLEKRPARFHGHPHDTSA